MCPVFGGSTVYRSHVIPHEWLRSVLDYWNRLWTGSDLPPFQSGVELSPFHSAESPQSSAVAVSPFQTATVSPFQTEAVETGMQSEAVLQYIVAGSLFHSECEVVSSLQTSVASPFQTAVVSPFQSGGVVAPGY